MSVRIGLDMVSAADVASALERHGDRYLERIYTPEEIAACHDGGGPAVPALLAERFAAKEAVLKALRRADEPIPWQEISVRRERGGSCAVTLRGAAAAAARAQGVCELHVSVSRGHTHAAAVAVAQTGTTR